MGQFAEIAEKFRAYHTNSLNVALHMVTTPMGIVAALIALRQNLAETEYAYEALVGAYVVSLLFTLKNVGLWFATAAWMGGLVVVADQLAPAFDAYARSSSSRPGTWARSSRTSSRTRRRSRARTSSSLSAGPALLLEHTYYLLPLCLDALVHMRESFASWIVAHNYVVRCKLTSKEDRAALKTVYDFVTAEDPARDQTAHWWYQRLEGKVSDAFTHVMQCEPMTGMFWERFRKDCYNVEPIPAMNEIYVASSHHDNNSDTVFYTQHCDAPGVSTPSATPTASCAR